jgi:hypothetical protein
MDLTTLTQPPGLYLLIAIAVVVVGLIVWGVVSSARRRRERGQLRERYGAEFDRAISEHGNRKAAMADLRSRESEHEALELRELNEADLGLVRHHMAAAQYRFVEDPADALLRVERVMAEVLRAKGYPVADDRTQAARMFSVDYPERAGSVRAVLTNGTNGDVGDLRQKFLEARKTISDVTGTSYVLDDIGPAPSPADDLRVEHDNPASTSADQSS